MDWQYRHMGELLSQSYANNPDWKTPPLDISYECKMCKKIIQCYEQPPIPFCHDCHEKLPKCAWCMLPCDPYTEAYKTKEMCGWCADNHPKQEKKVITSINSKTLNSSS